jgi:hypothetical protein
VPKELIGSESEEGEARLYAHQASPELVPALAATGPVTPAVPAEAVEARPIDQPVAGPPATPVQQADVRPPAAPDTNAATGERPSLPKRHAQTNLVPELLNVSGPLDGEPDVDQNPGLMAAFQRGMRSGQEADG